MNAEIEAYLQELVQEIAADKGFTVHLFECGEGDHVHCFVSAPPKLSITAIVKYLKGITGRKLFERFPEIREQLWKGELWNHSYYVESVGSVAEEFIRYGINVSLISNACDVDTKEAVGIREGAGVGHLGSINTVLARMDLKLEKEEFAELINRTFIEIVSVQSSDNSVYVVISASRRKKLQQTMQKFEKKYGQVIWIVPYMTGGEYSLDYCGIRPEGWEVK